MTRKLKLVTENGKTAWRIAEQGEEIKAPCEAMRRAREKALRVTAEIKAEKNSEQTGGTSGDST